MMRGIILIYMLLLVPGSIFAQLQKGKLLLGGSILVSSQTSSASNDTVSLPEGKVFNFSLGPSLGIMVSDNVVVGLNVSYGMGKHEHYAQLYNNERVKLNTENKSLSAGPFARFYKQVAGRFHIYAELQLNYGQEQVEQDFLDGSLIRKNDYIIKRYNANLIPGATYLITDKFGLELAFGGIGFSANNTDGNINGWDRKTTTYNLNLNPFNLFLNNITLGGRFYLGGNE